MFRPTSLLPALAAAALTLAAAPGAAAMTPSSPSEKPPQTTGLHSRLATGGIQERRRARAAGETTPLSVTIDTLAPSTIPKKGAVRVTGSVTNEDATPWTSVDVYAFISTSPIGSAADLESAAATEPATYVGGRITDPGTYDRLSDIDPGQSAQFSIKVPRADLHVTEAGVYWFGVHALGTGPDGRVDGADGRARTFLPLIPHTRQHVDTALVVPLRRGTSYAADGSLEGLPGWTKALSPEGRLRSLVDFGASAGSRPLTWLLDPSLPETVRTLADGNPPRSLGATVGADPGTPSESPSPTASGTAEPDPTVGTDQSPDAAAAAEAGSTWLDRLHEALRGNQILALPFGDLDVAAAAERAPSLYDRARARSGTSLPPWGLRMSPAIGSPSGYLNAAGITISDPGSTILVTDRMFPGDAPGVARTAGHRLVPTSSGAAEGGPGPDNPLAPVALRQRILSEAAVRLLAPGHQPLVVVLPESWSPSVSPGFFEGLDLDWVHLARVSDLAGRPGKAVPLDDLTYPGRQGRRELDAVNFASVASLVTAGQTLQTVLTRNDAVAGTVADEALHDASYASRKHPDASRAAADRSNDWITARLASIQIEAPRSVTLSSASGRFAATIVNNLEEPVTVSVQALTDPDLTISAPDSTVEIGPNGRTTVLLTASTRSPGIHNVTLTVTDTDGTPLGSSDVLPIRSAQVSQVIWVILGSGVALLFAAIAVRLFRRVRAAARARRSAP